MTSAYDLLAEARWEMEGVRRAAERYRQAAAAADPSTLPSGQKLLREVVPPLTAKIEELRVRGMELSRARGIAVKWAMPIQLVDADILAVITIVRCLSGAEVPTDQAASITCLSETIAIAVRDELDYRQWIDAQAIENQAAHDAKDWEHVDLAAQFKRRYPTADWKSWRRFKRKLELVKNEPWDLETRIQLGSALIHSLVVAAPDRFEVASRQLTKGRTQTYLKLNDETRLMLRDIETRAAVARPMLMPMLIPPIPWTVS